MDFMPWGKFTNKAYNGILESDPESDEYVQDKDDDIEASDHSIYTCLQFAANVYVDIFRYLDWTGIEDTIRRQAYRHNLTIFDCRDREAFDCVNASDSMVVVKLKNRKRFKGNRFVVAKHGEVVYVHDYNPAIHDNINLEIDAFKYYVFEER